jgi:hypothetical protein
MKNEPTKVHSTGQKNSSVRIRGTPLPNGQVRHKRGKRGKSPAPALLHISNKRRPRDLLFC